MCRINSHWPEKYSCFVLLMLYPILVCKHSLMGYGRVSAYCVIRGHLFSHLRQLPDSSSWHANYYLMCVCVCVFVCASMRFWGPFLILFLELFKFSIVKPVYGFEESCTRLENVIDGTKRYNLIFACFWTLLWFRGGYKNRRTVIKKKKQNCKELCWQKNSKPGQKLNRTISKPVPAWEY